MLFIRKADQEDLEEIAQVHADAWQAAYRNLLSPKDLTYGSLEKQRTRWKEKLAAEEHGHYVATEQGSIVGFFTLQEPKEADLPPGTLEVKAIYFAPNQWRKGYGTQCMSFILEKVREAEYKNISLWMLKDNDNAGAFYKKLGFVADGRQRPVAPDSTALEARYILAL